MELLEKKPESGSFNVEMHSDWGLVHRYFAFGRTEISFSAVVKEPLGKTVLTLHIESTKAVIAHLQSLVDRAEADQ